MLAIHDPARIEALMQDRAVWLTPVAQVPGFTNHIGAFLVRVEEAWQGLGGGPGLKELQKVSGQVAWYYSDHPTAHQPFLDPSAYANLVRDHDARADLTAEALAGAVTGPADELGRRPLWCLPFLDFDLHFPYHIPFVRFLAGLRLPNLLLFLVREEAAVGLAEPYEASNRIMGVDLEEMRDLHVLLRPFNVADVGA